MGDGKQAHRYELSPTALPEHDTAGRFCRLDADDWERLRRVETTHGEGVGLSLRRSPEWWAERTLAAWPGDTVPYCYGYERDGSLRGYLVYSVADETTLSVTGLASVDEKAHRALLCFLGRHGAQVDTVVIRRRAPTTVDLLDRVPDSDAVECTHRTGPMVRLTGVDGLETITWPDGRLDCTLGVTDPLVDHGDGLFQLGVADGSATVERVGDDPTSEQADLTVDVGTLSRLAVGTSGVEAATQLSELSLSDESLREPLSELFQPRPVCLREFF